MNKTFTELVTYIESLPQAKRPETRICRDIQATAEDALYFLGIEVPLAERDDFWRKAPPRVEVGAKNKGNRPFTVADSKRLAKAILDGEFELTGETAIFSDRCSVLDAQHRWGGLLWARHLWQKMKDADRLDEVYPHWSDREPFIEIYVVAGIPDQGHLANKIDTGRSRSNSDVVYRDYKFNEKYDVKERTALSKIVTQAARLVWGRVNGKTIRSTKKMDQRETMKFVYHHPGIVAMVEHVFDLDTNPDHKGCASRLVPLAVLAGLGYLMSVAKTPPGAGRDNPKELDYSLMTRTKTFISSLVKGSGLEEGNPILLLRNALGSMKGGASYKEREHRVRWVISAWNVWVDGTTSGLRLADIQPGPDDDPRIGGLDTAE